MQNPNIYKNPAYVDGNIRSCGIMLSDKQINAPMLTIIDLLRDQHYKIGIVEENIMERESMAVVLGNCMEENVFSAIQTNRAQPTSLLESIHEYFPAVAVNIVDNQKLAGYLEARFSEAVVQVAQSLHPAVSDIIDNGFEPSALERFNVNSELSYYVLFGERSCS